MDLRGARMDSGRPFRRQLQLIRRDSGGLDELSNVAGEK